MKSLFSFGFPLFLRIIIPGIFGTVILIPLIASISVKIGVDLEIFGNSLVNKGLLLAIFTLSIGLLVNFLDDFIYKIYEGYFCWPKRLRNYLTNKLNKKIKKKLQQAESTEDKNEYNMLWDWLLRFPLKKEKEKPETEAILPTKLGNILLSYESYPESRYGIETIFYWPRLWMALDKETRKEINTTWSEADCITYISFICLCSAVFYFFAFIFDLINIPTLILGPIGKPVNSITFGEIAISPLFFLVKAIVLLLLTKLFYLISLPLHVKNGNNFQALFDLHRDKLEKIFPIKVSDDDVWNEAWAYLKYGLIKCKKCSNFYPKDIKKCPHCKSLKKS